MNDINLKIARQILKIARELIASENYHYIYDPEHQKHPENGYYKTAKGWAKKEQDNQPKKLHVDTRRIKTKDENLQRMIRGAQGFTENEKFDSCFSNDGQFDKTLAIEPLSIDLGIMFPDMKGDTMDITMVIVDAGNKKSFQGLQKKYDGLIKNYPPGQGQALLYKDKPYIVIYCDKENGSKQQVKETAVHEAMHLMDWQFDDECTDDDYFGHPVEEDTSEENNYGIPYPGMPGKGMDCYDEKFAQYFTCKAQRKQTTYDLMSVIDDYSKQEQTNPKNLIKELLNCLNDKKKFEELSNKLGDMGYNNAALMMIYHLAFSKQKNGSKQDAKKILRNLIKIC